MGLVNIWLIVLVIFAKLYCVHNLYIFHIFKKGLPRHQKSKHRKDQPEEEEGSTSTAAEHKLSLNSA